MRKPWYRSHRIMSLIGLVSTVGLLILAFVLGLVSFGKMRQVVAEDFNQQQLAVAKNLATLIRQDIDFLRRELLVLNLAFPGEGAEAELWFSRMRATFSFVRSGEIVEIRHIDASGRTAEVMGPSGLMRVQEGDFSSEPYFEWAQRPESRGRVFLYRPNPASGEAGAPAPLYMATPHFRMRSEGDLSGKGDLFTGALMFLVDASALTTHFVADARSGTTGYAWVLDENGIFLSHPMEDFIGRNAFKARHEKDPRLGFEGINLIMRDHMLEGHEGTGEYVSGWHRQMKGPVDKLISYSPLAIDPLQPSLLWSVAMVAPASEVQGMVRSLFFRQFILQSAILLAILAGGISFIRMERYWSNLQKEKEQQINLSSRLSSLGTLAAGVAHEINNPIAIILGFTDLLIENAEPGTQEHEHLKIVEKQALACKKIVENLGRFARVPEQRAETTDINEELNRTLAMVKNTLLTEKVRIVTDLQKDLPPACGDPQGIQQVLLNLITNARGAMKQGGALTVESRAQGDTVMVAISDTGHGIAKRDLGRIFDPFFTTKAPGEGTGLGLSISHGIIEKAGGTITVESRQAEEGNQEPSGTTFRIYLPLASKARDTVF